MNEYIMSVTGPIAPDDLGFTLAHEHVLFDTTDWLVEPRTARKAQIAQMPVTPSILEDLRRDPVISRDNLTFFDEEIAAKELSLYREAGGVSIIEASNWDLVRRPEVLKRVSLASSVNIVMGLGHYVQAAHPESVRNQSAEEIADRMIEEIRHGAEGTDIRAGVIGEIGTSGEVPDEERKVLRASAMAQQETGVAISLHTPVPYEKNAMILVEVLGEAGADLGRCAMGHMYHSISDLDYHRRVADSGAILQYDRFGAEFYWESWPNGHFESPDKPGGYMEPRDWEVAQAIVQLCSEGYADRIMISHDIAYKIQLNHFGGHGFAHIPNHVCQYLLDLGVTEEQLRLITIDNPKQFLTVDGSRFPL